MFKKSTLCMILFLAVIMCFCPGCKKKDKTESKDPTKITIACDISNELLVKALVKDYNLNNKSDLKVEVMPSGEAVKALQDKKVDIIVGYEGIKEKKIKKKQIATDGFAIIVNNKNSLEGISVDLLRKIFIGETASWKSINGADSKIQPVVYKEDEDIQKQFEKQLINVPVKEQITKEAIVASNVEAVKEKIMSDESFIGFIPGIYVDKDVKLLSLNGIKLAPESLSNDLYALKNKIYVYTLEEGESSKQFEEYMGSDEGKKIIKKLSADAM